MSDGTHDAALVAPAVVQRPVGDAATDGDGSAVERARLVEGGSDFVQEVPVPFEVLQRVVHLVVVDGPP